MCSSREVWKRSSLRSFPPRPSLRAFIYTPCASGRRVVCVRCLSNTEIVAFTRGAVVRTPLVARVCSSVSSEFVTIVYCKIYYVSRVYTGRFVVRNVTRIIYYISGINDKRKKKIFFFSFRFSRRAKFYCLHTHTHTHARDSYPNTRRINGLSFHVHPSERWWSVFWSSWCFFFFFHTFLSNNRMNRYWNVCWPRSEWTGCGFTARVFAPYEFNRTTYS